LSEYVDYNKDVLLFGHAPEPIEEDKTWHLVGGNTNGIKPYRGYADLISVMERLKWIQTGTVFFQETSLECHNKSYRYEFQKLFVKAFGEARLEHSTTKDKFETLPFKPGGTASAALGEMVHCVVKTEGMTMVTDVGCISHSMENIISTLQLLTPIECALSVTRVIQQHPNSNSVSSIQMKI
jgi:hypothetical protein